MNSITNEEGVWLEGDHLAHHIVFYFSKLFSTSREQRPMHFLSNLEIKVPDSLKLDLDSEFTAEEISLALKQMHPTKASRPDGLPPLFYQRYWHIVVTKVTTAALCALNQGQIPSTLNHTFITLIPKKKQPSTVADYRPISLCNVPYKLISKVIADRLKRALPFVISES